MNTATVTTLVAKYADGTIARRGDVLITSTGDSVDFCSVKSAARTDGRGQHPATVLVRDTEVREVRATTVGLTVALVVP